MDNLQKNSNSKSKSVSLSMSVFSVLVHVLVRALVRVRFNIKYGTMNIYVLHGNYVVDSKDRTRWRRNLKSLLYESGLVRSAEHLGASSFKRDIPY